MLWVATLTGVLTVAWVQWDDAHWVQLDMIGTDLWDRSGWGSPESVGELTLTGSEYE